LLREHLLANPHRVTVVLSPDKALREGEDARERARLDAARATMTLADVEQIIAQTHTLKQMQVTPDSPEALATIPMLKLSDLDKRNKHTPSELITIGAAPVLFHDLVTNGIAYLDLGFDMRSIPAEDVPLLGLFGSMFLSMGTSREDFARLSQRIGRKTGGLRSSRVNGITRTSGDTAAWFFLRGKATMSQLDDLLDLIGDVLLDARLDDKERFKQIVLEEKAGLEARLVPSGHATANMRLRARFNASDWFSENTAGVSYLMFIRDLVARIENDWPAVLAQLERVRALLVNRAAMLCNVTLDAANWATLQPKLHELMQRMPQGAAVRNVWPVAAFPKAEGLSIPAQVNYVGKGTNLFKQGYAFHGSALVVNNYINTSWLWERVRVQGGAYGGFSQFDQRSGVYTYLSYRDPNLSKTLANYDGTGAFLREHPLTQQEVDKCIIGVIGDLDSHELPDARGYSALTRYLLESTDAYRQQLRDEVLGTTAEHFVRFADALDLVRDHGDVVVVGSTGAIEAANAELSEKLVLTKVL
jgi:hypothetical protein